MARFEPASIDNSGAVWTARSEYQLVPSAKRYELYEKNFAAVVSLQPHFLSAALACTCWANLMQGSSRGSALQLVIKGHNLEAGACKYGLSKSFGSSLPHGQCR